MEENINMTTARDDLWVVDSGSTAHLCGNKELFEDLRPTNRSLHWCFEAKSKAAEGVGSIRVVTDTGLEVTISDVLYVPGIKNNIISATKLTEKRLKVSLSSDGGKILGSNNQCLANLIKDKHLYWIQLIRRQETTLVTNEAEATRSNEDIMHDRFAHSSNYPSSIFCETCALQKLTEYQ
jgi:hypothetical protein